MKEESNLNIFYVYRLINPIDNVVFYIGSGKNDRVTKHWINFLKYGMKSCNGNYDKYCILKSIKEAGLKPIEEILTKRNMFDRTAEDLESKYILKIGRLCNGTGPLVNIKVYQRCPSRTVEVAEKISISHKKNRLNNKKPKRKPHTEETKNKIRLAKLGKKSSEETKKKQSESHKGEKHWNFGGTISEEHKEIIRKLPRKSGKDHFTYHKIYITNNIENKLIFENEPTPEGWRKGRCGDYSYLKKKDAKQHSNKRPFKRITNGVENRTLGINDIIPDGWRRGSTTFYSDKARKGIAESRKNAIGNRWITNGKIETFIRAGDPFPEGFKFGRLPKN